MKRDCPSCGSQVIDTITNRGEAFFVDPDPVDGSNVKLDFEYSPPRSTPARPVDGEDRYRAHNCPYRPHTNHDHAILILAKSAYQMARDRGTVQGPDWHRLGRRDREMWLRVAVESYAKKEGWDRPRGLLRQALSHILGLRKR